MQPGADMGGIGMGLVRMVRPWDEWLIVWGYDINEPPPEVDEEVATRVVHNLVGDDTIDVTLRSTSLWGNNKMYAKRYASGRVFCMGDACHRHPPSNGLGSNTSIGDAYNLAWKLALVLGGKAAPSLLDSYDAERAPIGEQIVLRANKSIEEFGPIFDALGLLDTTDPEQMRANMEIRKENSPAGAEARAKLRAAIELKNYEFNAHGVELGQRYRSGAVVPDGTPEPAYDRDPELYYHPTTWPGARLPHAWLEHRGEKVSTLDLAGKGRFALLTGIGGEAWVDAARAVSRAHRRRDRAVRDRPGARRVRHLRRLGAAARGRGDRLRARAPRRARGLAGDERGRRRGGAAGAGDGVPPGRSVMSERESAAPVNGGGEFDATADIVVVGGGGGGLPAALFSRWNGDEVILLEKAPELGGTAKKAAFWYWIPNNVQMQAAGIADPEEDFLRYAARLSRPQLV